MANFSKLHKYQTFGLIELHNLSKGQLADRIFKLWKSYVYDYGHRTNSFWNSEFLIFPTFLKNFMIFRLSRKQNFMVGLLIHT